MNSKFLSICLSLLCTLFLGCADMQKKNNTNAPPILLQDNLRYKAATTNSGDISAERREYLARKGQAPYAIVIACSDSRVVPEHIFNVGIGQIFVIRNAGNIISDIELASIEYAVVHLHVDKILVMGHTDCGAVGAAIKGNATGKVKFITDIIQKAIGQEEDITKAVIANAENSVSQILKSDIIRKLYKENKVNILDAVYNLETGQVVFRRNY